MTNATVAKINLAALAHNTSEIKRLMPKQKMLPMIKGNAYGHGLCEIARAYSNEKALGVASLSEALLLRKAGIRTPIVVMRGFCNAEELTAFATAHQLIACIHDKSQLALLQTTRLSLAKPIHVWLKIDTGMHRLGFDYKDSHEVFKKLTQLSNVVLPVKIFTHLADADGVNTIFTDTQLHQFTKAIDGITVEKSVLNSAGILSYSDAGYDWVRPGIALYGASPFPTNLPQYQKMQHFRPVMTLTSHLIAIKRILPGETIGYGCTFRAEKEMVVGVVGSGYGDGYPRHAKTGTPVLIKGKRCPIVGRVSMDMFTVDITTYHNAFSVGDSVTLWGEQLPIDEIATCANTIPHELLTRVTGRVQYIYLN